MATIRVGDSTTMYYKDWGEGPFRRVSHGWPLDSGAWDGQSLSSRSIVTGAALASAQVPALRFCYKLEHRWS